MKNFTVLTLLLLFMVSCVRQEPIPQQELTGIWKLNGFASTTYKVEFTADGYAYWWNYRDWFNRVEEFEVEYQIGRNTVYLYRPGSRVVSEQFRIYKQRNGGLYFSIPVNGTDVDGNPVMSTNTYYRMH